MQRCVDFVRVGVNGRVNPLAVLGRVAVALRANHLIATTFGESPRTTKLDDRNSDAISLDERACPAPVPASGAMAGAGIERILIEVAIRDDLRQQVVDTPASVPGRSRTG